MPKNDDIGVPEVTKIYEPCQQQIALRRCCLRCALPSKKDLWTMLPEVCTSIKRDLHMNLCQGKRDLLTLTYLRRRCSLTSL